MEHRHPQGAVRALRGSAVPTRSFDMRAIMNFVHGEEGQDLVEYALLAALLSIVSIATLKVLGPKIRDTWTNIANEL
jgi:pilus assembly protein Flp/PilA